MGFYSKKLIRRCREELNIALPDDVIVRCCRPSWSSRSAGAFSWVFESKKKPMFSGAGDIGSQYTVRECAMSETLVASTEQYDVFLFPKNP